MVYLPLLNVLVFRVSVFRMLLVFRVSLSVLILWSVFGVSVVGVGEQVRGVCVHSIGLHDASV